MAGAHHAPAIFRACHATRPHLGAWRLRPDTHEAFMRLFLGPGVHAAHVGEDLVILDTLTDAYFCLAAAAELIALGPGGHVAVSQDDVAAQLLEAGLLALEPAPSRVPVPPRPIASTRLASPASPVTLELVLAIVASTLKVGRRFSRQSFASLLEGPEPSALALQNPSSALTDAVAQFETLRPWLPLQGECLLRSYHLRTFLRARGLDALWVFGVRTWPFDAHCWLQAGDTALDEDLERLNAYHPIMAV